MEGSEVEVIERNPLLPVVDVEKALDAWDAYQSLCRKLLSPDDYAKIRGKAFRKRSGWAKLRRFYHISTDILKEQYWATEDDWGFDVAVRAESPEGRAETADGSCSYSECWQDYQKALARGNSPDPPTRHTVRSKAIARAKNRATSDIMGVGEISAEELPDNLNGHGREPQVAKYKERTSQNGRVDKLNSVEEFFAILNISRPVILEKLEQRFGVNSPSKLPDEQLDELVTMIEKSTDDQDFLRRLTGETA